MTDRDPESPRGLDPTSPSARGLLCLAVLCLSIALPAFAQRPPEDRLIAGVVERVAVGDGAIVVEAKLDTGADSCSLQASEIEPFRRDGSRWVRFVVAGADGRRVTLESRLIKTIRVKSQGILHRRRPVVRLPVCLGDVRREVEINLADRSALRYPMLIGRNFLSGRVLVDPQREHATRPDCVPGAAQ